MRTRVLACALVGWGLFACGRTNLLLSADIARDAGTAADGTATQHTGSMPDPGATSDPGAVPEGGSMADEAGAPACYVPESVATLPTPGCAVWLPSNNNGCGPSEYAVGCGESVSFTVPNDCYNPCPSCNGGPGYCCPCLAADAGVACVDTDVSTYDRSCSKDSDCINIQSVMCAGECYCACGGNAAINVDGRARYQQAVAPVLPLLNNTCTCENCPESPSGAFGAFCDHGVCAPSQ